MQFKVNTKFWKFANDFKKVFMGNIRVKFWQEGKEDKAVFQNIPEAILDRVLMLKRPKGHYAMPMYEVFKEEDYLNELNNIKDESISNEQAGNTDRSDNLHRRLEMDGKEKTQETKKLEGRNAGNKRRNKTKAKRKPDNKRDKKSIG